MESVLIVDNQLSIKDSKVVAKEVLEELEQDIERRQIDELLKELEKKENEVS